VILTARNGKVEEVEGPLASDIAAMEDDVVLARRHNDVLIVSLHNHDVSHHRVYGIQDTTPPTEEIMFRKAIDAAPHLAFVYPAEGFPFYCDCAVILRESRRGRLAHRFLDYLLRPAVSARIVESTRTATANASALDLLPESVRRTPSLYPPREIFDRGEWPRPLDPVTQRLRDRIWTEIKSA